MRTARATCIALLTAALVLAGCGDDAGDGQAGGRATSADTAAGLSHIHGLGVDPGSGRLLIATHHGLFEAPAGDTSVSQVGESRQDIMGFSVATPDRLIGSGHPAPGQDLPPHLGLIESLDGGKTWKSVSLSGKADFHVLRSSGDRIYGFNGLTSRLMVSVDGGRSWNSRKPPSPLIDLAVNPSRGSVVVAASERGIISSADGGQRWTKPPNRANGLLAWPSADRLYLVDGQGRVSRSADAGKSFKPIGSVGGQPVAFASHENDLYVARADGTVMASANGGASWALRAQP